jgi:ABC transporter DrrB family efflux protein
MSGVAAKPPAIEGARPMSVPVALEDILAVTRRNVLHLWRVPQLLFFSSLQPVMFVLLFRYVFGGAIQVPGGGGYVNYLMPGIFVQIALFGGASTSVGLAMDFKGGIIDRMRTLPMTRSAVLAGRTLADLIRNILVVALMLIVGTLVGFRFRGSPAADALGVVLVLAFGYAFSWVFAAIGLAVKDPETAQLAGFVPIFPLVFASSAFVPVQTMPGWLQAWANHQPVSIAVDSARALFSAQPAWHYVWQLLAWVAGILLIFIPLAVRQYRKA